MKTPYFRRGLAALLVLLLLGAVAFLYLGYSENQSRKDAPSFPHASLSIRRADGQIFPYAVEVATTPQQEMYGLMYRRSMPADHGMIFVYEPDQVFSMWMKNTYIPLDMIFVQRDGTVTKIVANAQPFDLTPIPSGDAIHGVIEINGGEATRHGFKPGDKVLFPGFDGQPE